MIEREARHHFRVFQGHLRYRTAGEEGGRSGAESRGTFVVNKAAVVRLRIVQSLSLALDPHETESTGETKAACEIARGEQTVALPSALDRHDLESVEKLRTPTPFHRLKLLPTQRVYP